MRRPGIIHFEWAENSISGFAHDTVPSISSNRRKGQPHPKTETRTDAIALWDHEKLVALGFLLFVAGPFRTRSRWWFQHSHHSIRRPTHSSTDSLLETLFNFPQDGKNSGKKNRKMDRRVRRRHFNCGDSSPCKCRRRHWKRRKRERRRRRRRRPPSVYADDYNGSEPQRWWRHRQPPRAAGLGNMNYLFIDAPIDCRGSRAVAAAVVCPIAERRVHFHQDGVIAAIRSLSLSLSVPLCLSFSPFLSLCIDMRRCKPSVPASYQREVAAIFFLRFYCGVFFSCWCWF